MRFYTLLKLLSGHQRSPRVSRLKEISKCLELMILNLKYGVTTSDPTGSFFFLKNVPNLRFYMKNM